MGNGQCDIFPVLVDLTELMLRGDFNALDATWHWKISLWMGKLVLVFWLQNTFI